MNLDPSLKSAWFSKFHNLVLMKEKLVLFQLEPLTGLFACVSLRRYDEALADLLHDVLVGLMPR